MRRVILGGLFLFLLLGCRPQAQPTLIPPTATSLPATAIVPAGPTLVSGTDGMPWWNDTVFYEVFVRSFYDSDGDGIGDLNGLIEKLDYLNDGDPTTTTDLGVTGLWLMPIMESSSYHGYDVLDYYQVDSDYGSNEDFKRLMAEAHERGMRVIVDLVLNHTGRDHPWFIESRDPNSDKRDWYLWQEAKPNYRGPWGQEVWHPAGGSYYYAVFWDGMPDLNYNNPDVTAQMFDVVNFWAEEMEVDGFRLDAIKHLIENGAVQENSPATHGWFEQFYNHYKDIDPQFFTVGEAWTSTNEVLEYIGDEVDLAFQFDLALAAIASVKGGDSIHYELVQEQIVSDFPAGQYATFLTNHDQNRLMSQLTLRQERAKLAASLLLTSPGVPFIYYGEEIGMRGIKPDEQLRRPMQWTSDSPGGGFSDGTPWQPLERTYPQFNVSLQTADQTSLLSHYRQLIGLRNSYEALRIGDWYGVDSDLDTLYAFVRASDEETVLVLLNLGDEPITEYALTLPAGIITAGTSPTILLGDGPVAPFSLNDDGGFGNYRPVASLPAASTTIILLSTP